MRVTIYGLFKTLIYRVIENWRRQAFQMAQNIGLYEPRRCSGHQSRKLRVLR